MSRYQLESHWHIDAPIEAVWQALHDVDDWPKWWPSVIDVTNISQAWTNVVAPFLGPMFRWNHGKVMAAGAQGLNAWLRRGVAS